MYRTSCASLASFFLFQYIFAYDELCNVYNILNNVGKKNNLIMIELFRLFNYWNYKLFNCRHITAMKQFFLI